MTTALVNMNLSIPSSLISTQTVAIKTDVELVYPLIACPIIATLTPSAAYINLAPDFKTISVNASLMVLPTDLGTHPFTLTVNSGNFSGSVV